jgi:hypothetical protein
MPAAVLSNKSKTIEKSEVVKFKARFFLLLNIYRRLTAIWNKTFHIAETPLRQSRQRQHRAHKTAENEYKTQSTALACTQPDTDRIRPDTA